MDYQFFFWLSGIVNVSTGGNEIVIFCQNCDITNVNINSKGGIVQNIFKKKKDKTYPETKVAFNYV